MTKYRVRTSVTQESVKLVELIITADSIEEAEDKAREALNVYPSPVPDASVLRVVALHQDFTPPSSVTFIMTRPDKGPK